MERNTMPCFETLASFAVALDQAEDVLNLLGTRGCPCFEIQAGKTRISGHCWRVCFDCKGCGFHVVGSDASNEQEAVARVLKRKLDEMDWYGEWDVKWTARN